ncbi:MAG: hypothetical protein JRN67_11550, partial [Nitrososphaerota archaeon]|nr:hypothetical protein [Nitrososphaerota archaeon]
QGRKESEQGAGKGHKTRSKIRELTWKFLTSVKGAQPPSQRSEGGVGEVSRVHDTRQDRRIERLEGKDSVHTELSGLAGCTSSI